MGMSESIVKGDPQKGARFGLQVFGAVWALLIARAPAGPTRDAATVPESRTLGPMGQLMHAWE